MNGRRVGWKHGTAAGVLALALAFPAAAAKPREFADVETRDAPYGAFGRSAFASVWVAAPPKAVFDVLTAYETFHEYMPLVERVEVLEREPRRALLKLHMRYLRFFDIEQVDERKLFPPTHITYKGVAGAIKSLKGSWRFEPERGGTRLRYEAHVDPGVYVPGVVMGALVKRGLPGLLDGVRRRVESGGTWKKGTFP